MSDNKALVVRDELDNVRQGLVSMKSRVAEMLPNGMDIDRFNNVFLFAAKKNPDLLLKCDRDSLYSAAITAASLGLEPDPYLGQAFIVPYYDKRLRGHAARLDVGYRGLIALATRSGLLTSISAHIFWSKEMDKTNGYFDYQFGLHENLIHKPGWGDKGEMMGAYAQAKFKDGQYYFDVLTRDDILKIRAGSSGFQAMGDNSPWITHPEEMWKKTAIRRIAKFLPLTVQRAAAYDQQVEKYGGDYAILPDDLAPQLTGDATDPEPASRLDVFAEVAEAPTPVTEEQGAPNNGSQK